jgi:hypothetical protein
MFSEAFRQSASIWRIEAGTFQPQDADSAG